MCERTIHISHGVRCVMFGKQIRLGSVQLIPLAVVSKLFAHLHTPEPRKCDVGLLNSPVLVCIRYRLPRNGGESIEPSY